MGSFQTGALDELIEYSSAACEQIAEEPSTDEVQQQFSFNADEVATCRQSVVSEAVSFAAEPMSHSSSLAEFSDSEQRKRSDEQDELASLCSSFAGLQNEVLT